MLLVLTLDEFRFVREKPYRFLVAIDHATSVDQVVKREDGYDVVEFVESYRAFLPDLMLSDARPQSPERD